MSARAMTTRRHQALQRAAWAGAARADHKSPLREVQRRAVRRIDVGDGRRLPLPGYLLLECGHVVREPTGWGASWQEGSRRRCKPCAEGQPATPAEEFE